MFKDLFKKKEKDEPQAESNTCAVCGKGPDDDNFDGMLVLHTNDGRTVNFCTDCAYLIYTAVDNILEEYSEMAESALSQFFSAAGVEAAEQKPQLADGEKGQAEDGGDGHTTEDDLENFRCTPQSVYEQLCRRVIGQDRAKKVIAVALYNHWKRMVADRDGQPTLQKSNILLIGPTGTGKTLLAETAADILGVPFVTIDATSLSETGYKGNDVEMAVERLMEDAEGDVWLAEHGIVYIDEIDKLVPRGDDAGLVGTDGVQKALLKLVEGTEVEVEEFQEGNGPTAWASALVGASKTVRVDTSSILFICGGAFVGLREKIMERAEKRAIGFSANLGGTTATPEAALAAAGPTNEDLEKYGIIPELAGRLPVKAILEPLTKEDLIRILTEPDGSAVSQYQMALSTDGVEANFTREALERIAEKALKEKAGARGLKSVLDGLLLETMFHAPTLEGNYRLTLTADDVDGITRPEDHLEKLPDKPKTDDEDTWITGADEDEGKDGDTPPKDTQAPESTPAGPDGKDADQADEH